MTEPLQNVGNFLFSNLDVICFVAAVAGVGIGVVQELVEEKLSERHARQIVEEKERENVG